MANNDSRMLVRFVQNPAIAAFSIWRFIAGACSVDPEKRVDLHSLLAVYPAISNRKMRDVICHTNSGLWKCRNKLTRDNDNGVLISIRRNALQQRSLSVCAIGIATDHGLIEFDASSKSFSVGNRRKNVPSSLYAQLSNVEREFERAAYKLGKWFAGMSSYEFLMALGLVSDL